MMARVSIGSRQFLRLLCAGAFLTSIGVLIAPCARAASNVFEPLEFFAGATRSSGILESPIGTRRQKFVASAWGSLEHGQLRFVQSVLSPNGQSSKRVWLFRKVGAREYEGTANDVIGVAKGKVRGKVFRLEYLVATDGNSAVRLRQTFELQNDGSVMNRTLLRKSGRNIARISERFERSAQAFPVATHHRRSAVRTAQAAH